MEMVRATKPSAFIIQQKEKLQKEMDELLGTDGVFFYPSHPRVAPKHHHLLFRATDCAYTGQSSSSSNSVRNTCKKIKLFSEHLLVVGTVVCSLEGSTASSVFFYTLFDFLYSQ